MLSLKDILNINKTVRDFLYHKRSCESGPSDNNGLGAAPEYRLGLDGTFAQLYLAEYF
jgi:hypothetical protein